MRKKRIYSKAQGALEFITTYGWAFLVIIIMTAALSYFGIFKPSNILPERCNIGKEFECADFGIIYGGAAGNTGQVIFRLRNNVGTDIFVDSVTVKTESVELYSCTITDDGSKWGIRLLKDFTSTETCNSDNAQFSKGKKGKVLITITYYKVGASAFKHTIEGEIFATLR